MTLRWLVIQIPRQTEAPGRILGAVDAADRTEALRMAHQRWNNLQLTVVSDVQWRSLTDKERAITLGTYTVPKVRKASGAGTVRSLRCAACHKPILYHRDDTGKWPRPPKYHPQCRTIPSLPPDARS